MDEHRTMDRLIDNQVRTWERQKGTSQGPTGRYYPAIAISRAFGAGGNAVAHEVGRRTGFPVWDRELVQEIARDAGADERIMASLDERRRSAMDDAIRSIMKSVDTTNVQYFRSLMRVLRTVAHHGSAVIVGRGANCALPEERVFRVRITAPLAWRENQVMRDRELSHTEASKVVRQRDRERADFVWHYFHQDVDDPATYDVVLNAASLSVEERADVLLHAYAKRFHFELPSASG